MKKLLAPVALAAVLALTGCGAADTPSTGAAGTKGAEATETAETAPQIPDLTGVWKSAVSESGDSYQQATITADTLTVDWVSDGGDTTSIFWIGTFVAPVDDTEPYMWTSQRDVEATQSALLASTEDAKEFTYEDGAIKYQVSMMGTSKIVKLTKD